MSRRQILLIYYDKWSSFIWYKNMPTFSTIHGGITSVQSEAPSIILAFTMHSKAVDLLVFLAVLGITVATPIQARAYVSFCFNSYLFQLTNCQWLSCPSSVSCGPGRKSMSTQECSRPIHYHDMGQVSVPLRRWHKLWSRRHHWNYCIQSAGLCWCLRNFRQIQWRLRLVHARCGYCTQLCDK